MTRSSVLRRAVCVAAAAILALFGVVFATPAQAAGTTRYVATDGDDGNGDNVINDCTDPNNPCEHVQYAVDQADPGDTVSIGAGTYHESVHIRESLTLLGAGTAGAPATTIDGDGDGDPSIFVDGFDTNTPPEVTIQNLNVSNNSDDDGIVVESATVHVIDCVVSHNDRNGITIEDQSTATVASTDVSDNRNEGIVLEFNARVVGDSPKRATVLPNATVTGSSVNGNGDGGVIVEDGQADIVDTTLDGNVGAGMVLDGGGTHGSLTTSTVSHTVPFSDTEGEAFGGGILVFPGGQVAIATSTIFGNAGQGVLDWAGSVTIDNSTISGTVSPDGGTSSGGPEDLPFGGIAVKTSIPQRVQPRKTSYGRTQANSVPARGALPVPIVTGTIVADNKQVPDCNGDVTDDGYNLDSDGTCAWSMDTSLSNAKAKLGPLGDNGGPTQTLYLAKTSDAVDRIPTGSANCSTKADDQRGVGRPQGAKCDIGAVEDGQSAIVISPDRLPHGKVGRHYSAQLSATGGLGAPYEFSLAPNSDPLPDGLTLRADGKISGTPTTAGRYPVTVSVDDPTLKDYVIVITAPAPPPSSPTVTPPSTGPIANTGTPVAGLSLTAGLAILAGVIVLLAAGWIGTRPGRHRIH